MKSALMAVNGYIDLLAPEKTGEIYEHAKHSTGALEAVIENLVSAMRAARNTEPIELSLNQCVRSEVELIRSNPTFRGKVKFTLELTENDIIHVVPADVMTRLESFISGEAKRLLADGAYKLTVGTGNKSGNGFVRIGSAEITFPNSTA